MSPMHGPARTVTAMTLDDLPAVLAIEQAAYPLPWREKIFVDCLNAGYFGRLLHVGPQLVGYALTSVAAGEAHLLNLCVAPERQGAGHAVALLDTVVELCSRHAAETLFLEVRASNRRAIALYQRYGFAEFGVRRGYYPAATPAGKSRRAQREDAITMGYALIGQAPHSVALDSA